MYIYTNYSLTTWALNKFKSIGIIGKTWGDEDYAVGASKWSEWGRSGNEWGRYRNTCIWRKLPEQFYFQVEDESVRFEINSEHVYRRNDGKGPRCVATRHQGMWGGGYSIFNLGGRGWGPIRWRGWLGLSNISVSHPCLSPPWVCDDLRPRYVMTTYRIKTRDSGMMISEL